LFIDLFGSLLVHEHGVKILLGINADDAEVVVDVLGTKF
jgi:hypothetical protein